MNPKTGTHVVCVARSGVAIIYKRLISISRINYYFVSLVAIRKLDFLHKKFTLYNPDYYSPSQSDYYHPPNSAKTAKTSTKNPENI